MNKEMLWSMLGYAIGDSMGVPYEGRARGSFQCTGMRASKKDDMHGSLPIGTWSDDTSLTLCCLEAISHENIKEAFENNIINWFDNGDFTTNNQRPFDVGGSCRLGITKLKAHEPNVYADEIDSNGNGGLMRILPLIFKDFESMEAILKAIRDINHVTHAHTISDIGSLFYILMGKEILKGNDLITSYNKAVWNMGTRKIDEYERIWSLQIMKLDESSIKSTGYVVDTLEAALWCLLNGSSYKDTILKAINLGGDTDTIAAIAGGLAGLHYKRIPIAWVLKLKSKPLLFKMCNVL